MKFYFLFLISVLVITSFNAKEEKLNPTGTYHLKSKTIKKDGEIYGYFGKIQVKKLNSEKIIMTFEVNKGAPSYNSGSFVDTLIYKNNRAIYKISELSSTCKIIFDFNKKGITVTEKAADYNSCGFGMNVIADGFYKKTSNKVPILIEPLTGKKL